MAELAEGWGWPGNSRKPHYFKAGEATSVCGKWMFTGQRDPDAGKPGRDDCTACSRKAFNREPAR